MYRLMIRSLVMGLYILVFSVLITHAFTGAMKEVTKTASGEFLYHIGSYRIGITTLLIAGLALFIPIVLNVWAQITDGLVSAVTLANSLGLNEVAEQVARAVEAELAGLERDARRARLWLLGSFFVATVVVISLITIEEFHVPVLEQDDWVLDAYRVLPIAYTIAIAVVIITLIGVLGQVIVVRQPNIMKIQHQRKILREFIHSTREAGTGRQHNELDMGRTTRRPSTRTDSIWAILTIVAVCSALEAILWLLYQDSQIYPRPSKVIRELYALVRQPRFFVDIGVSTVRAVGGFVSGAILAVLIGVITGRSTRGLKGATGILHVLRAIPIVALVPLAITWLGIGWESKLVLVFWGAFFPTWIATHLGVRKVNYKLLWVAATLGAGGTRRAFGVALPAATPTVIAGARTGVAISFIALVAAEMTGTSNGIGYRIMEAYQNIQVPRMIAYILLLALLAAFADRGLAKLLDWCLPWYKKMG